MQLDDIKDPIFITGRKILGILSEHGEAYIVGGAVRDLVMGNQIHDVDISTNVPMEVIEALFETHDIGKNKDFGIVVVNVDGVNFEIAQFRSDGSYTDGRRPDSVQLGVSFKEDTKRRDFTMNAMGLDLNGNIIDYHGGLEDIRCGRLKTVGKAFDRFEEDLLRILRAIRFAARFGYQLDDEIMEAIEKQKDRILTVSMERIRDEILKTIAYGADKFTRALWIIDNLWLLETLFPGLYKAENLGFHRSGRVYDEGPFIKDFILFMKDAKTTDPVVVLGALFQTLSHEDCKKVCEHLKLTSDDTKDILYVNANLGTQYTGYYGIRYIDKQSALKIVQNRAFNKLRLAYTLSYPLRIGLNEQDNNVAEVLAYVPVQQKQKDVNAVLLTMGFKGKEFGEMQAQVNSWMFNEFGKDSTLKTDSEIKEFILMKSATEK